VSEEPAESGRLPPVLTDFDLLDEVGVGLAHFGNVEVPPKQDGPRLNARIVKESLTSAARDPTKRWLLIAYGAAVLVFSVVVIVLLVNGTLADFYESIWSRWPGRPWTEVMRDNPWIYLVLAVVLAIVPLLLAPRDRWGRAFLTYVVFWIGFLGGHVFW
jgi:hypothetical protein